MVLIGTEIKTNIVQIVGEPKVCYFNIFLHGQVNLQKRAQSHHKTIFVKKIVFKSPVFWLEFGQTTTATATGLWVQIKWGFSLLTPGLADSEIRFKTVPKEFWSLSDPIIIYFNQIIASHNEYNSNNTTSIIIQRG